MGACSKLQKALVHNSVCQCQCWNLNPAERLIRKNGEEGTGWELTPKLSCAMNYIKWYSNFLFRRCPSFRGGLGWGVDLAIPLQLCISISSPVYEAPCKLWVLAVGVLPLAYASAKYFILPWLPFDQFSSCISLPKQVQRRFVEDLSSWGLVLMSVLKIKH